jgi:hypothetical protein
MVVSIWATVIHSMALLYAGTNISAEALHWALDTVMSRAFTSEEAGGWPCCHFGCVFLHRSVPRWIVQLADAGTT